MDESNIIVILQIIVSLFAGVVGAILALVGQHLVSKRTTETEMKKTVLATFLPTRLKAYTDYISALKTWSEVRDDSSCAGTVCLLYTSGPSIFAPNIPAIKRPMQSLVVDYRSGSCSQSEK